MIKFTKIILGCTLLASTQVILADDLYRCGNTYQDSPCPNGSSRPINEKPFKPSISNKSVTANGNKAAATKNTTENASKKPKAITKAKPISKTKPITAPVTLKPAPQTESAQTASPSATQPATTPPVSAQTVETQTAPTQKSVEQDIAGDEQGVCSSLKAGLKNIDEQKRKGGNTADLKQQRINLENAMHSAGC